MSAQATAKLDTLTKETSATKTEAESPDGFRTTSRLALVWVTPRRKLDWLVDGSVLGRIDSCGIHLISTAVSRAHAKITKDGPLWLIRDLRSKNGTSVDGKKLPLAQLEEQSVVRVGEWVGVVTRLPVDTTPESLFVELSPGFLLGPNSRAQLLRARKVAERHIPVLIHGETGTGKELCADLIHRWSRRSGPIVALNCAAIPESVAEAELFGHRRGAFTGADRSNPGYLASAHQGTLFLDEVPDLPQAIQTKLLRALEQRSVAPLGSTEAKPVDFRLVAASQEPLERLVEEGEFRRDLYARLAGAEVGLPPLRRRREEILPILEHAFAATGAGDLEVDARLVETLCLWHWKSNVRELVQLGRLMAASGQRRLSVADLPHKYREPPSRASDSKSDDAQGAGPGRREAWLARHAEELAKLGVALEQSNGNLSEASRQTGIPRYRARRMLAAAAELKNAT